MEKHDVDYSFEAIPKTGRKGFWSMFVVMMGFTFFSASMMSGGKLGTGLSMTNFFLAVLFGNLILAVYTGLLANVAVRTGLSTHLLARYSFGRLGSFLPSSLLGLTQVGWFGVGVAMFAFPVHEFTGWNLWTIVLVSGLLMTFTAWFGFKALTILSFVAVPAIAILGLYSVNKGLGEMGGFAGWLEQVPESPMGMYAAIGICVASFISGGTLTPDFTRYGRTPKIAVGTTVLAFLLGNSLMFLFGAVGAAVYKEADISIVLKLQGLLGWAIVVLGLNIWTTNDSALYASGLGFSNITGLPKRWLVLFNGVLGTFLSVFLYNNFVGYLSMLNLLLPAIGGVLIADYYLLNKKSYQVYDNKTFKKVNVLAVLAWGAGVAAAFYLPGIQPLNAFLGGFIVYVILGFSLKDKGRF